MQIAFLRSTTNFFASRSALYIASPWSKRLEDRIEMLNDFRLAPDHLTVAPLEPPYASAGTHIDVVNSFRFQLTSAANVVDVVRVASIDDDVVGAQPLC